MRITIKHKLFDTILLFLLVFSSGGLLFWFNRNLFTVVLFVLSLFTIIFMGKKLTRTVFNTSLFTLICFSFLICFNYIFSIGNQSFIKYGFHLLNITSCVLIASHFINNRDSLYFLQRMKWILRIILYFSIFNFLSYLVLKSYLTPVTHKEEILHTFNYIFL